MQSPKDGYEYVVLEGNNRLKVYKDLHKDHSEKKDYTGKWERIPCEVYENYDPDVYHEIQLTSHVITKKPWEPYARGEYLYKLQMSGKTLDQLAAICGGTRRKKDIQLEIDAYSHMQQWRGRKSDGTEQVYNPSEFQKFYQYQLKRDPYNDMGLSPDIFLELIAKRKIVNARDVTRLDTIWNNQELNVDNRALVKSELMSEEGDTQTAFALRDRLLSVGNDNMLIAEIVALAENLTGAIRQFGNLRDREELARNENYVNVFENLGDAVTDLLEEIESIKENIFNNPNA